MNEMATIKRTVQSINFTDFDFAVDRTRIMTAASYDGSMTIRMPGKDRKTANHELIFIPYFKKNKVKFKTVAIGKSRNKKIKDPIVVFDQGTLAQESAIIRNYGRISGLVNSKGHALKMLEVFNIRVPKKKNQVLKIFFKLHPTVVNGNKFNYRICTMSIVKILNGDSQEKPPRFYSKRKLVKKKEVLQLEGGKEGATPVAIPENLI